MLSIAANALFHLTGYDPALLKFSSRLKGIAFMSGLLLLFQFLLVFGLAFLIVGLFNKTKTVGVISGLTLSYAWYHGVRVSILSIQQHRSLITLSILIAINFFFGVVLGTAAIGYVSAITFELQHFSYSMTIEKMFSASIDAFLATDHIQTIILIASLYSGLIIFMLLPYMMIYNNRQHPYYKMMKTYKLFKTA